MVNGDAVGWGEDFFEGFVKVGDFFGLMFAANVGGDPFHWAGAIKGAHGDDVFELGWFEFF